MSTILEVGFKSGKEKKSTVHKQNKIDYNSYVQSQNIIISDSKRTSSSSNGEN